MKLNATLLKSTVVAALGGLLFGFDTAVISGAERALQRAFHLSPLWLGFTVASALIGTIIGSSYNPTFYWQDTSAMRYIRFNGTAWSDTLSIPIDSNLTFDKALRLLEGMAARN